jgi:hypothetical protein
MIESRSGFTCRIPYLFSVGDIASIPLIFATTIGINTHTAVGICVNPANVNRHYSGSQSIRPHATVEVEKERGGSKMAELHKEVAEYLTEQRERVCVIATQQERETKAADQETVEEAYARRHRELGW